MFPQIFGKYVLERELASGGMARVFLATLKGAGGFEKRLVVKQIRPELASDQSFIQRFVAEAKTTVSLSHPGIVPVYELGAERGVYYIAMEFCAGVSLAELLAAGVASPSEGAYIGVEICRALDYAHRKAGVVHRDVTPRNVMIDSEGMVRLIDFGIAAPASAGQSGGPLFGSPGHMPPEQLRPGPLTPAADVFAVAVLLIEAWTGRAPFRRESFEASRRALDEPRPPLADTDARLDALQPLIDGALAHAPERRPQTAEDFARPLREFLRQDDLGDIARRLGQRVSERQRELGGEAPGSNGPLSAARSMPAACIDQTQTFAAHGALLEWTGRIESIPPLPESTAQIGCTAEIESGITAPSSTHAPSPTPSPLRRAGARGLGALLAVAAMLVVALGGYQWSHRSPVEAAAPAATNIPLEAPPLPEPNPPREIPTPVQLDTPVATKAAPPQPSRAARAPRPAENPAEARPRAASTPPRAPLARLQLTADPDAWVEVDGTRVGRTPLNGFTTTPGRHQLRFINQLLGEKLETSITLDDKRVPRVHADFTSASPQVYVR
jgi:serine/threonine-protein kinase